MAKRVYTGKEQRARLVYADRDGWSLVTPRDVAIFGPTWSMSELQRWAVDNHIDYRVDSVHEREEAAQSIQG